MLLVTQLLITKTRCLQTVFIVKLLILLRGISCLHWNWERCSKVRRYDSRQYTANACIYLCQYSVSVALLESVNSVNRFLGCAWIRACICRTSYSPCIISCSHR